MGKKKASNEKAREGIAAALSNGNLSRGEALKIAEASGKSVENIMNRAVKQGGTLGSALVNSYNSGSLPGSTSMANVYGNAISNSFGGGDAGSKMAQALDPVRFSPTMQQVRSAPTISSGNVLSIGSNGQHQTILPKSQVTGSSSGSRTNGSATDSIYDFTKSTPGTDPKGPWSTSYIESWNAANGGGTGTTAAPTAEAMPPPIEPPKPEKLDIPGIGSDLITGASGFRGKKSSRQRLKISSQGLSSMKVSPKNSKNVGLNIGNLARGLFFAPNNAR